MRPPCWTLPIAGRIPLMILWIFQQVLLDHLVLSYQHHNKHSKHPLDHHGHGESRLTTREILRHNPVIKVPLGRRYAMDPLEDLAIQVRPGDRCTVTVLGETDKLMMRPGRLQPSSFPCRYLPDSVTYTHLGGRAPGEDRVRLQIRYDSDTDTIIIPFTIEVDVSFVQLEIVTKNMPITVTELGGQSTPIDRSKLQFTYDRENEICRVTAIGGQPQPRFGRLEHAQTSSDLIGLDCDEFLTSQVKYVHTDGRKTADMDWIPMMVEVVKSNGTDMRQEFFQIPVRIREGNYNTPPRLVDSSTLNLVVNQFILTAITPQILAAYDEETVSERLVFNITKAPAYGEGYIVSTADSNMPIHSFSQKDVQDLNIAYKPPSSDSSGTRVIEAELQIVDEQGSKSDTYPLTIVVRPMNTMAPIVTRNQGIQLFEGQSRPITSWQNLEISDEDDLGNVQIKVIDGLRHGQLWVNGVQSRGFTPADLDAGVVRYSHDHSDTYSDNIIFKMIDGDRNSVEFLFPVTIYPVDDEAPVLNVNIGLVINKNASVPLTTSLLSATDVDSNEFSIKYKLLLSDKLPVARFTKRQLDVPPDPENWTKANGYYEKAVREWTQADIMEGKIHFHHIARYSSPRMVMERIPFILVDDAERPNESGQHELVVQVMPSDDEPPEIYDSSITLRMSANEKTLTQFTRRNLRYTDTFANDRLLKYELLAQPSDTDDKFIDMGGKVVLCSDPQNEVRSFTQAQINHHKICYRPPDQELGTTSHIIQFPFKVEDLSGNSLDRQVFTIYLRPVDNEPPRAINNGLTLLENGESAINTDMIDISDVDSSPEYLRIIIKNLPKHGKLTLDEVAVKEGQVISLAILGSGRFHYKNHGEEVKRDSFDLEVSDGKHHVPLTFPITIRLVDDERPTIDLPSGKLGITLSVSEKKKVQISSNILQASDADTEDLSLIFNVEGGPYQGRILLKGKPTESFTQKDLVDGNVYYQHTLGEIGHSEQVDVFNLTVSDREDDWIVQGNHLTGVTVSVIILPRDDKAPNVTTHNVFKVTEGSSQTVNAHYVSIYDADTQHDLLLCRIITQPSFGYLENISPGKGSEKSRAGRRIDHFTANDLVSNNINYVQSHHKGIEPKDDHLMFQCYDSSNNSSPVVAFPIVIEPTNDEVPVLFAREFVVQEGRSLILDIPILNAIDADEPSEKLVFTVVQDPIHGSIFQQKATDSLKVTSFTLEDLRGRGAGSVYYEHDDSETTQDSMRLQVSDSKHRVEKDIMITVIPVDDETPRITINTGLDILPGETKAITNQALMATDLDSPDTNITFIIRRPPVFGYLQLNINGNFENLTRGMSFKQLDIDTGRLRYQQSGRGDVRDLIKFDVTDGHNPHIDRYFYITVEGADDSFPVVVNRGVELPEGGNVVLNTNLLSTYDTHADVTRLRYTITRSPQHGFLENTDNPGKPISTFTQLELAGNKVRYVHVGQDESSVDSFEFEVTDGQNHVWRTLRVSVSPVDNKKPVLMIQKIKLMENGVKVITPFELRAMDSDTEESHLEFWVTKPPVHGTLEYNYTRTVSQFTMADINENLISYKHDGSEATSDGFKVRLTDGTHHDFFVFPETKRTTWHAQHVEVEIVQVDNQAPYLIVNAGGTDLQQLVGLGMGVELSPRILKAGDGDSPEDQLVYTVTSPPEYGEITNINTGLAVTEWSQGEMEPGWIVYLLAPTTNVTNDHFRFSITDPGGNTLEDQEFLLRWAWLSLEMTSIDVDEDQGDLEVKVKRRGSLEHTAFVTVTAVDGTALAGHDFEMPPSSQVQFGPGETEKVFRLRLVSDGVYEATEYFTLQLHAPVSAATEAPLTTTVRVNDSRDESVVSPGVAHLEVREDTGEALIPLLRTGDISDELQVICFTVQGSAKGTDPHSVTSFSDYITRSRDHYSIIRFDKGQHNVFCPVTVIDDSLYEEKENFYVYLSDPLGGQLGPQNRTEVIILKDEEDEPVVYFGRASYEVDESVGVVEVLLWRAGTDLSRPATVTVRSRSHPEITPAQVGEDYVGVHRDVTFGPGESLQQVRVRILDDVGVVSMEGARSFQLVLTMPDNVTLGDPSVITITINDSDSDLPQLKLTKSQYTTSETEGRVMALIERSGDLSYPVSVRCYTRQASATVAEDFDERPNTDVSAVTFKPGQREAPCIVLILPDNIHEDDEQFYIVLGSATSGAPGGARLVDPKRATVTITDDADASVIMFGETRFVIREPQSIDRVTRVTLPVIRLGDTSRTSIVRVHTRDGTAKATKDYIGFSKELTFTPGVTSQEVEVVILYDDEVELREAFSVIVTHDKNRVAKVKNNRAIVFIEELSGWADVTFPSPPLVVSLKDYDHVETSDESPTSGYPIICVTACDPRYPDYDHVTRGICHREGINNTLTQYRWRTAPPPGHDGNQHDLQDLETNTFFTSVNSAALDSVFFKPGSQVQCIARAVNRGGEPGLELSSPKVTISNTEAICPPRIPGSIGTEPFTATIMYTGPEDDVHPNLVKIRVRMPHRDGLIPVISTQPITNLEFALSDSAFRVAQHVCSNLLTPSEVASGHGFLDSHEKAALSPWLHSMPFQHSRVLRTNNTVNFYRALDLDSCLWEFEGYYDLSQLVDVCGGKSSSVGQVLDLTQSFLSVTVPLYVSYVYFNPVLLRQWAHYDLNTKLKLTFVYNTAITWQRAVLPAGGGPIQGRIHPMRMQINDEGRLLVTFRSEALFRGQFVSDYPGTQLRSSVTCPDKPHMSFSLVTQRSDATYDQPQQTWQFTSDIAVSDYTCNYAISLVPCTVSRDQRYNLPTRCRPEAPIPFTVPLRLQQVNEEVATNLTLNTTLNVWRNRNSWLSGGKGENQDTDVSFTPDDFIYGLVRMDASQNVGTAYDVSVEKVFVCTGVEDFIPHYKPNEGKYGCLGPNSKLLHTIRVLDKGSPAAINTRFQGADFEAQFATEDNQPGDLLATPGLDGFRFSAKPLFKVDPGHHWFLHVIYSVKSSTPHRAKRSLHLPMISHTSKQQLAASAKLQHHAGSSGPEHHHHHNHQNYHSSPAMFTNADLRHVLHKTSSIVHKNQLTPEIIDKRGLDLTPRADFSIGRERRRSRREAVVPQDVGAHTGTGTNMVVIALDYSFITKSSSLFSDDTEELSAPRVSLVAGLSTAFIVVVAVVLTIITIARYKTLHQEDDEDSGEVSQYCVPPPPPPPPSSNPANQQPTCRKVTQV